MYLLPLLHTPPFCDLLPGKRWGGGVTMRTWLSPRPPTNSRTEINEALLCSRRRELLRSIYLAVAVLKDGRVVDHVHVAILAARLLPLAARLHSRMMCRITGLRKPSKISEKGQYQFSNYFLHALYTNTTLLRLQHAYMCKNCSTANRFKCTTGGGGGV